MFRALISKWGPPAAAAAVTLGVVFAAGGLRPSSPTPAHAAAAHAIHQAAAPTAVTTAGFTLVTDTMGSFRFSEMDSISSAVEASEYLGTTGTGIVDPATYGRTKPPTAILKRTLSLDAGGKRLLQWHTLATDGSPKARTNARLIVTDSTGKTVVTYLLQKAWASKIDIAGTKIGGSPAVVVTLTLTANQISVQ